MTDRSSSNFVLRSTGAGSVSPNRTVDFVQWTFGRGSANARVVLRHRPSGLIFADGFESGDTSAWSATVP